MNILAIDTSFETCSAAILLDSGQIRSILKVAPRKQSQLLLPMIDQLLRDANILFNQLDAIAYGSGPGSFTGVRIATTVAQGIGWGQNIPLIPISSMAALAQSVCLESAQNLPHYFLVAIDAHMGRVYWSIYERDSFNLVKLLGNEQLSLPQDLKIQDNIVTDESFFNKHWQALGDGFRKYGDYFMDNLAFQLSSCHLFQVVNTEGMLLLAQKNMRKGNMLKASDAHTQYFS